MNGIRFLPILAAALLPALAGRLDAQSLPTDEERAAYVDRVATALLDTGARRLTPPSLPATRRFTHNHTIIVGFDSDRTATTVTAEIMRYGSSAFARFNMDAFFWYKGQLVVALPRYVFILFRPEPFPGDWHFRDDHRVTFVVDDTLKVDGGETFWDGSAGNGSAATRKEELISLLVPIDRFLQLVNARKAELQVGKRSQSFTEDQLEALRDFASRMAPTGPKGQR